MKRLNVQSHLPIVCYDAQGMFSVARAAWMFRYFGGNVRILDGGFKAWSAESRGMTSRLYD
jgi:thiosulfate/3-mercaptopyruvate sulfurtransferase